MKTEEILYIGCGNLLEQSASAKRTLANAKILKSIGYKVTMLGVHNYKNKEKIITELEGVKCICTKEEKNSKYYLKRLFRINDVIDIFKQNPNFKYLICYNYDFIAMFRLIKFFKHKGVKVISDTTEFYEKIEGSLSYRVIKTLDNFFRIKYLNKKVDGLILVSSYLRSLYKNQNSIVVPTLIPYNTKKYNYNDKKEYIEFLYAGFPFNINKKLEDKSLAKERIDLFILSLYNIKKAYDFKFEFSIYGITKEQFLNGFPNLKEPLDFLNSEVIFYGIKESNFIKEKIKESDFTVLIRESNLRNNAGFPTKFSESIVNGTPVIATNTSDLEKYLEEGKNGFFVECNVDDISRKLIEIMKMDYKEILSMKKVCLKNNHFDLEKWKLLFQNLLERLS